MACETIPETTEPKRFPRLKGDEGELKRERARLTAQAWRLFTMRRKVRIELGRVFIGIEATFRHGDRESYYQETFGSTDVSLHTIQRWMRWARKAHADAKNDKPSLSKRAMDPGAVVSRAQPVTLRYLCYSGYPRFCELLAFYAGRGDLIGLPHERPLGGSRCQMT